MISRGNKYFAYVRVSSQEQAEKNISIPSQIEQVENYAKNNWYTIIEIYKEENSAFKGTRKVFSKLLEDLKKRTDIKWLIIFKFDRLSRNLDDFIKIDKIIRDKNLEILSVTEPMLNSYLGRYLIRDMQNRAILYSEELSFRVKLWIRKKLQMWWSMWWYTPFWYDNIKWKLVPNDKAKIVQEIFKLYSYWQYWIVEIEKNIKVRHWIKKLPRIERILSNFLYIWKTVKKWVIWNEEYIFWWYDKAWTYYEEYNLNYIIPIISEELFNTCQKIKEERTKKIVAKNITYPKIFKCSCWRNLARDDKKWNIYLRCPKKINLTFPDKCNQWYVNLNNIKSDLQDIMNKIFLTDEIRNKMISFLKDDIISKINNKNEILKSNEDKLELLKGKQLDITNSFIENKISKETFEISSEKINKEIEEINNIMESLNDINKYISANEKAVRFIEVLWVLESKYKEYQKKSSHHFFGLFTIGANFILGTKKVLSYELKHPFDLLDFSKNIDWCPERESNSHSSLNGILSPTCLPIPPSGQI